MEASIAWVFRFPCFGTIPYTLTSTSYEAGAVPLHHCHVEDFIELAPATPLLLLIPEDYSSYDDFEECWILQ
eukprot:scaffold26035_cov34-Attheya_sp.AAC.2